MNLIYKILSCSSDYVFLFLFFFFWHCVNAETTVMIEQREFTSANTPKQTDTDIIPMGKHDQIQGNSKLQAASHSAQGWSSHSCAEWSDHRSDIRLWQHVCWVTRCADSCALNPVRLFVDVAWLKAEGSKLWQTLVSLCSLTDLSAVQVAVSSKSFMNLLRRLQALRWGSKLWKKKITGGAV